MQIIRAYLASIVTNDGRYSLLKALAPIIFFTIFVAVQFSSQQISNLRVDKIMLQASVLSVVVYWYKYRFVPSTGIAITLFSMLVSTVWLVSQSISWKANASCITIFAVFWGAGVLSGAMPIKQVNFLLKSCCLTAFLATIYQAITHYGSNAAHGMDHPDFGWAMYGTTLPGQCVYLALWTFMFLQSEGKSNYRYIYFYIIFALNCLFATLFNVRLMVPILVLAAIMPWFLHDKLKTFCLRSGLLLTLLVLAIFSTSLLFLLESTYSRFGVVKSYTGKTLLDRMKSTAEDGGSGRLELYRMGLEKLKEKNITSLLLGDGGLYTVGLTGGRDMHNIYLETLHGFGLLGLAGLVTIVISMTHREWNNRFQHPLGATLITYFITGFMIFGFREPMIWFLLGTYDACRYEECKQHSPIHTRA